MLGNRRSPSTKLGNQRSYLFLHPCKLQPEPSLPETFTKQEVRTTYGGQIAERLGNRAINQKVAGLIPGLQNDVVSLGKALHPTCLWGNVPVLTIRASAK